MKPFEILLNKTRSAFYSVKAFLQSAMLAREFPYRIEEIDPMTNRVIIHCYGTRTLIKTNLSDAIYDVSLLNGLPSKQTCWLGYYHGKSQREAIISGKKTIQTQDASFLLSYNQERYKIVSMDRHSRITYIDVNTQKNHIESPVNILKNKLIISNFGPSQSCYIGILAGIEVVKYGEEILSLPNKPLLTIVK
jgi:hypothetical protein